MERLGHFWDIVASVWQEGLLGISIGRLVGAVVIIFAAILLRRLFARYVIHRISLLTRKTKTRLDDVALEFLAKPLGFVPVILGVYFASECLSLSGPLESGMRQLVRSLIVFVIFWCLVRLVEPLSSILRRLEETFTSSMVAWLIKAIKIVFIFVGAATILEIWGIRIGPILAGLGLLGVAVALGAQDLFRNLISGILIIGEKRFHAGEWIKVAGLVEGTVESIGFRSTIVRRFDKALVHVPNSQLADSSVTNFSRMTHRRISWLVGVEYRTTVDQLRQIRDQIEEYILGSEEFAHPPQVATFVRIDRFSDSSIDIFIYCFTKTTDWGQWLEIKERLAFRIKEIVFAAGTGFAFPSQSIYVESIVSDRPEIFVPPEE